MPASLLNNVGTTTSVSSERGTPPSRASPHNGSVPSRLVIRRRASAVANSLIGTTTMKPKSANHPLPRPASESIQTTIATRAAVTAAIVPT